MIGFFSVNFISLGRNCVPSVNFFRGILFLITYIFTISEYD